MQASGGLYAGRWGENRRDKPGGSLFGLASLA